MNWFDFFISLLLFISAGIGFTYGVVKLFKKGNSLFTQIVACAIGCMMLGWLFNVVTLLTSGNIANGFHVGKLGLAGGFIFIFSASFGQMNGLVDGGEKRFRKYRVIALVAPVTVVLSYLPLWLSSASIETKCVDSILFIIIALCSYFNLKHLIIPDVDFGILKSIRMYNFMALILSALSVANLLSQGRQWIILTLVTAILIAIVYILILPVLVKGANKWTI